MVARNAPQAVSTRLRAVAPYGTWSIEPDRT